MPGAGPCLRQLKASAGSGKTYELTRCFLERLARCGPPTGGAASACALAPDGREGWGDILAITFTNAAAAEMRDRVLLRLKRAALGLDTRGCPLTPEAAGRWVDVIMRNMSALNIRTIDSLLHLVVRAAALDLDLHPDFQPVFATEEALAPYLDLVMERAWQGDEDMRDLLRQVFRALARREGARGFFAGEKLHELLRPLMDGMLCGRFADAAGQEAIRQRLARLETEAEQAARALAAAAETHNLSFNRNARALVDALAARQARDSAFLHKESASDLFLKKPAVDSAVQSAYALFAAAGRALCRKGALLREALVLAPALRLAQTLAEAFARNQRQEGSLPGLLIPRMARQVLEGGQGVPETLCRMGVRLRHFLVDEFQDTSREQWLALRPLVEEALSRGGSLTWVGDVKQSVYGWRGGEPELFDAVLDDRGLMAMAQTARRDSLPYNWRSRREIVAYNNAIFGPLASPDTARDVMQALLPSGTPEEVTDASARLLAQAFAGTEQRCPDDAAGGGQVRVEALEADSSAELDEAVLDRLRALLLEEIAPARPWSDVLVLVRSNARAALVADCLVKAGVPVVTENSLLLSAQPLVAQTVALLAFLDNPEDDIAFMTVIAGELFHDHPDAGLPPVEELAGWCAGSGRAPLFKRFQAAWPRAWRRLLAPFHSQSGLMTPYDITLEWYARLDAEARFPHAVTFLRRFMEVLHTAEEKGLGTLPAFLEHWQLRGDEEKAPMPEAMDAVRIMTIHRSKGLEAPVVIVPWTDLRARPDTAPALVDLDGLRLVTANRKHLGRPYYEGLARQCRENMHLLYVAFTRARDCLHVFRTEVTGGRGSAVDALDLLWQAAGHTPPCALGDGLPGSVRPPAAPKPTATPAPMASFPADWRPMNWLPRLKIFRNPLTGFRFRASDRGSLLHLCLEHLRCTGHPRDDAEAALRFGLAHLDLPAPEDPSLRESLADALAWFAAQPQSGRWLREGWPEHPLMDAGGHVLRADLLVPETDGTLVLDYKSGQPQPAHVRQLRAYLACLPSGGFAGLPWGLLVYLDLRRFVRVTADSVSAPAASVDELPPRQGALP